MFLHRCAHTGSGSLARYQPPTGHEPNVQFVLPGNADNSMSVVGDEEDEDLQNAQLVQALPTPPGHQNRQILQLQEERQAE